MVLRYKDIHAFDNNKTMKIIYSMYRAGEVSVHRACCERATQLYSLGGGGTIYPGSRPAGVTIRCPRMVTQCLLTRSMLIKMYKFTILGYVSVYVHCIYSQSISHFISAWTSKDLQFRFCSFAQSWLPKFWRSASPLTLCLHCQIWDVPPPHFSSALTAKDL